MGKPRLPENSSLLITTLIITRLWSAISNLIYDCDETYNYWEVAHYLIYNNGFITWEYSPQYALRSYFYLWLYVWPSFILSYIISNELILFYLTRLIIACFSVFCELYFCIGLSRCAGSSVGRYCMAFLLMSSGTYLSSTAFLPNTLSMHLTMIAFGAWFCDQYKMTIFLAGISILIGWPYAAIVYSPIAISMLLNKRKQLYFLIFTLVYGLMILTPLIIVDSYYYGKIVIAPINAVLYNVFNQNAGPELYGVESSTYYFINLALNFNFLLLVSSFSVPMLAHKEERFMYPIYPLICATAALGTKLIKRFVSGTKQPHSSPVFKVIVFFGCIAYLGISLSRVIAVHKGFGASFEVFADLKKYDRDGYKPIVNATSLLTVEQSINVCYGKEWYRYPNSFFLPNSKRYRMRFVKSDFEGQLPKLFEPEAGDKSMKTRIVYNDFNDINKEEITRFVNPDQCHYMIDTSDTSITSRQPDYSKYSATWVSLTSHDILNLAESPPLIRSFYIPFVSHKRNRYNKLHLLRNKKLFVQNTNKLN